MGGLANEPGAMQWLCPPAIISSVLILRSGTSLQTMVLYCYRGWGNYRGRVAKSLILGYN